MKKILIAIDGFSACGKSTTAKGAAKVLKYTFVDSGAMYRAVSLYFINENIDYTKLDLVKSALKNIHLQFRYNTGKEVSEMYLNGVNVEEQIREMNVSNIVSQVSSIKEVRIAMVEQQRLMGSDKGIVMDGRDIGTNVFPMADLKFFVTADIDIRVDRRFKELMDKGQIVNKEEIKRNLEKRDYLDQNRKDNPLLKADDALMMDTSNMRIEEQIIEVVNRAKEIIEN